MARQIIIDGRQMEVDDGLTLLQACELAGADVPRFCYHERLSIAGNCRMCLVEVVGIPKPQASCAMGVADLPPRRDGKVHEVNTKSAMVKKAREGVMEFLLINHPLDCPICDQGGECDLQDQAMAFGLGASRYAENKRAVEDKHLGPLIKTMMTRCIHCTRCVRFMTEVAGVEELGAIGRGEDMEITTYLEHGIMSELSANVVDLCPVGALTHRPSAFAARPWEMQKTESIDVMDAIGSAIRVDSRGREVLRILPRTNDAVNEEWISDKARHIVDGLRTQRLDQPYVRAASGRLEPTNWDTALDRVAAQIKASAPEAIGAIAGDLAGVEEMYALKDLLTRLGAKSLDCRQDGGRFDPSLGRASYLFNPTIEGIEQTDAILIIGSNPRLEAPVLNARIRKRWRQGGLAVGLIGPRADLTYDAEHLGNGPQTLKEVLDGRHPFADKLKAAKRPLILVGPAAAARPDGAVVLSAAARLALECAQGKDLSASPLGVMHAAASRAGGLDIGFVPAAGGRDVEGMLAAAEQGQLQALILLGADEIAMGRLGRTFVVYIGSHGDAGAHRADVILPGSAYTEKSVTYVNTEGRVQQTARAGIAPGNARQDWAILRALSAKVGHTLPYDTIEALRAALYAEVPHLASLGSVTPQPVKALEALAMKGGTMGGEPFGVAVADYYLTNPIARASGIMAELSALRAGAHVGVVPGRAAAKGTGTHG